jgi:hypothetical protein
MLIQEFFNAGLPNIAHIPLRNPFNIADSWQRRYPNCGIDKEQSIVNDALFRQAIMIREHPAMVSVHKIEDLPVLRGVGPNPEAWPEPEELLKLTRMVELRKFMHDNAFVTDFYREYYTDEELWWL